MDWKSQLQRRRARASRQKPRPCPSWPCPSRALRRERRQNRDWAGSTGRCTRTALLTAPFSVGMIRQQRARLVTQSNSPCCRGGCMYHADIGRGARPLSARKIVSSCFEENEGLQSSCDSKCSDRSRFKIDPDFQSPFSSYFDSHRLISYYACIYLRLYLRRWIEQL